MEGREGDVGGDSAGFSAKTTQNEGFAQQAPTSSIQYTHQSVSSIRKQRGDI